MNTAIMKKITPHFSSHSHLFKVRFWLYAALFSTLLLLSYLKLIKSIVRWELFFRMSIKCCTHVVQWPRLRNWRFANGNFGNFGMEMLPPYKLWYVTLVRWIWWRYISLVLSYAFSLSKYIKTNKAENNAMHFKINLYRNFYLFLCREPCTRVTGQS